MRVLITLVLGVAAASAIADPLIDIPTARKIPFEQFKLEFSDKLWDSQSQLAWLDAGIGKSLEATVEAERFGRTHVESSEDLMYSVIAAIPGLSPGIALGVQDIANTSEDKRRFYAVTTYRKPYRSLDGEIPIDLTLGLYFRDGRGFYPFGGVSMPISHKWKALAEYNGDRFSEGIEFDTSHALALRLLVRGSDTLADVVWTARF